MYDNEKHFFTECTHFPWRMSDWERRDKLATDVRHVTCGQCKGRILDAARAIDWANLSEEVRIALTVFASCVKLTR